MPKKNLTGLNTRSTNKRLKIKSDCPSNCLNSSTYSKKFKSKVSDEDRSSNQEKNWPVIDALIKISKCEVDPVYVAPSKVSHVGQFQISEENNKLLTTHISIESNQETKSAQVYEFANYSKVSINNLILLFVSSDSLDCINKYNYLVIPYSEYDKLCSYIINESETTVIVPVTESSNGYSLTVIGGCSPREIVGIIKKDYNEQKELKPHVTDKASSDFLAEALFSDYIQNQKNKKNRTPICSLKLSQNDYALLVDNYYSDKKKISSIDSFCCISLNWHEKYTNQLMLPTKAQPLALFCHDQYNIVKMNDNNQYLVVPNIYINPLLSKLNTSATFTNNIMRSMPYSSLQSIMAQISTKINSERQNKNNEIISKHYQACNEVKNFLADKLPNWWRNIVQTVPNNIVVTNPLLPWISSWVKLSEKEFLALQSLQLKVLQRLTEENVLPINICTNLYFINTVNFSSTKIAPNSQKHPVSKVTESSLKKSHSTVRHKVKDDAFDHKTDAFTVNNQGRHHTVAKRPSSHSQNANTVIKNSRRKINHRS